MEILRTILQGLSALISAWMTFAMVYQLVLGGFGFRKGRRDYAEHAPKTRFLILVPAHNEQAVIADIADNLGRMEYPKELYDYYVIADNCTDDTAQIAAAHGARVLETRRERPDSPTGKPIALKKALDMLGDYEKNYDMVMIFDADNLMDTNMLSELNSQYQDKGHPDFIQCYLGSKNKKGCIAWFYYTSYVVVNRFTQLSKYRRGLNNSIGGTGFAVSTAYLKSRGGWTTQSLTEDFEIQVDVTLKGKKILWNHFTRVYDEKPTSAFASFRQKTRWSQGYTFVAFRNTGKVIRAMLKREISFREFLSVITYMWGMFTYVLVVLQQAVRLVLRLPYFQIVAEPFSLLKELPGAIIFSYSYLVLFYVAEKLDDGTLSLKKLPMMIWSLIVNMLISIASQFVGMFRWRQQQNWDKTEHKIRALQSATEQSN